MKLFLGSVFLIGVLLALWEIASQTIADEFFISRPTIIAQKFVALVVSGRLFFHGGITVVETLAGFVAGAAAGILFGLLLGRNEGLSRPLCSIPVAFKNLPQMGLPPPFIYLFVIRV